MKAEILPAGGLLGSKVLRNQFQSCIQVLFSSHRVVGSEVHPNVRPSFLLQDEDVEERME